jgi:hypothetical protein
MATLGNEGAPRSITVDDLTVPQFRAVAAAAKELHGQGCYVAINLEAAPPETVVGVATSLEEARQIAADSDADIVVLRLRPLTDCDIGEDFDPESHICDCTFVDAEPLTIQEQENGVMRNPRPRRKVTAVHVHLDWLDNSNNTVTDRYKFKKMKHNVIQQDIITLTPSAKAKVDSCLVMHHLLHGE